MCEHCHEHHHEHHHAEKSPIARVIAAAIILLVAVFLPAESYVNFFVFLLAYLIAGYDVIFNAIKNIFRGRVFDENFLMGLATVGAMAIHEYPEAVMVMILYQIGEYLQDCAVEKSQKSITELMNLKPDYANIEENGKLVQKSPENIAINDIITVKAGEKIPLDGTVIEGQAAIDTSALTGESLPREIKVGEDAISGCINTNGLLKIRVTKGFTESTVSKILELVEHASSKKAKTEKFITRFAKYYTPIVVIGALLLAFLPPLLTGAAFDIWFARALTFLVISCPCALVISVPLGFFAGIGGASRNGILIKGSNYLEALSKPYAFVFDKTGTLTKGKFSVTKICPINTTKEELLKNAAYVENYSNHPIALSIKVAYGNKIEETKIANVSEIAGNGVIADVDNNTVIAGNDKLMKQYGINYTDAQEDGTLIHLAVNKAYYGYLVISDEIKEDAVSSILSLKKFADKIVMLTGDNSKTADIVSKKLGITDTYSQLLPSHKVEKLEELIEQKTKGKSVIFTGDGINDAPVLTRADVGIAMGGLGSDAAIEAADVVIMDDKLSKILTAVKIAQKTMTIVKENIAFSISVKILFLILGAMGCMTMWGAVFADVGVALIAVVNSLRALKTNCT